MASSKHKQRAVLAGLSCGLGVAAPAVVYAATLPFGPVHEIVASNAISFTVGAFAGVGFYAASLGVAEHREERRVREAEESRVFGGAQPTTQFKIDARFQQQARQNGASTQNAANDQRVWDRPVEVLDRRFDTGRIPRVEQDAPRQQAPLRSQTPVGSASGQPSAPSYSSLSGDTNSLSQGTGSILSGLTGVLHRRRSLDDVPTISRAAGAPSEDEAWAMIDSMLDEDSPVSCDPARSRDVYQVAIDEIKGAGAEAGNLNREDIAAAARAVAGSHVAPAGTTAQFVSLVANANATAAGTAQGQASTWAQPAAASQAATSQNSDDAESAAAREAAVNSLWGAPAVNAVKTADTAVPYNDALASLPVINAAGDAVPVSADDTFVASMAAYAPQNAGVPQASDTLQVADASSAVFNGDAETDYLGDDDSPVETDVPMADYSGHEDMWAAALAVLDEPAPKAAPAVNTVAEAPSMDAEPGYVGTHSRVFPEDTARMSRRGIERAEAIAEGVLANRRHARVNEILEEEIDRIDSRSVRRTGHEYLSVIEGGTSSFPAVRAEA